MFPLRDDNPTEIPPFFTMGIIAACVAVWFWLQGAGLGRDALMESVCAYGLIPAEVTGAAEGSRDVRLGPGQLCEPGGLTWATLFSSMFLHGSWMHLIGNMWIHISLERGRIMRVLRGRCAASVPVRRVLRA